MLPCAWRARLSCLPASSFAVAASPADGDPDAAAVTQVWSYIGELVFNMLVLVGAVKMATALCAR